MARRDPDHARLNRHASAAPGALVWSDGQLFDFLPTVSKPFLLILDQVTDPHNLGACIRSANAAGAHAVIVPKDNSAPLTDTVARVACGAAQVTPLVTVVNLSRFMAKIKEMGVWVTGADESGEKSIYDADLKWPVALALGAEGKGLRRLTAESCDFLVSIPMRGDVPCLNVSVAAGICLFESLRQNLACLKSN